MGKLCIAICDDDEIALHTIKDFCEQLLKKNNLMYILDTYKSGTPLINSSCKYDLVLLDIQMPEIDGIKIKNLFEKNYDTRIIFISNYKDRVYDAFGCNVFAYVKKQELSTFEYVMKKFINEWKDRIFISIDNQQRKLVDLIYIEGDGSYSNLHFKDTSSVQRKNLKYYMQCFSKNGFFRIHKSYVINLYHIISISSTKVILTNNVQLNIKRGFQEEIKKAHLAYIRSRSL